MCKHTTGFRIIGRIKHTSKQIIGITVVFTGYWQKNKKVYIYGAI